MRVPASLFFSDYVAKATNSPVHCRSRHNLSVKNTILILATLSRLLRSLIYLWLQSDIFHWSANTTLKSFLSFVRQLMI